METNADQQIRLIQDFDTAMDMLAHFGKTDTQLRQVQNALLFLIVKQLDYANKSLAHLQP